MVHEMKSHVIKPDRGSKMDLAVKNREMVHRNVKIQENSKFD